MKLIQLIYQNQPIDFYASTEESVMVNATQMSEVFNKRIDVFLKTEHAKKFIEVLEKHLSDNIIQPPNGGRITPKVLENRGRNGMFFDKRLALKFASWLDPEFEVWVYSKIDDLILGAYREHKLATIEKIKAKEELEKKRLELIERNPELNEFFEIENKVSAAGKQQTKAIRDSIKEIQMQFFA